MTRIDPASQAQLRAADPKRSTWVTANAGSGKTKVLTDRVARLLLDGTEPQKILCLTYTKAAAAEMQNRLFSRLGGWSMMPDDALRKTLGALGEESLDADDLRRARRLFANALETPGGLKIQTIHAFCEKILRRFPLEAGVPPRFEVLDDVAAAQMRARVLDDIATGADAGLIDRVAAELSGADPDVLLREIAQKRDRLRIAAVHQTMGRAVAPDHAALRQDILGPDGVGLLRRVAEAAETVGWAENVRALAAETDPEAFVSAAVDLFTLGSGSKVEPLGPKRLGAAKFRKKNSALGEEFDALIDRVAGVRDQLAQARLVDRAERLAEFADGFLPRYDRAKILAGRLDFDDLIQRTAALLAGSASAQWVLYRLDGGIDHILVDEAQDTSPAQWAIVARLAEEFMAGEGRSDTLRTIFVVGDEKQSIYSFQGADPKEFFRMRRDFASRLEAAGQALSNADLLYSFRSSRAVLRAVDAVFAGRAGLQFDTPPQHQVFHDQMPGRVDLWPFLDKQDPPEEPPWYEPTDLPDPADPRKTLAERVADWVAARVDPEDPTPLPGAGRAVRPGDILILVQSRGRFFRHVIKALKARQVAVAGADRMKLHDELVALDILSLLRWADLPDDDLALAEALRSPLFGATEAELFALAHGRTGTLWQRLRDDPDHTGWADMLRDLLDKADYLRPYELIERVLTHHDGRARLLARLGEEAEEAIDELLSQALIYEQRDIPTLAGFLHWFAGEAVEAKREMDTTGNQVRVMTVHGAKGLEAPIVILPDTEVQKGRGDAAALLDLEDGGFFWRGGAPDKLQTRAALAAQARRAQFLEAERLRLLYVAMTRAERWLVIAGAGDKGKEPGKSWYGLAEEAFIVPQEGGIAAFHTVEEPGVGPILTQQFNWQSDAGAVVAAPMAAAPGLPEWATQPAPVIPAAPKSVNPSLLPGAKALPGSGGASEVVAKRHGSQVHLMLEHLPNVPRAEHFSRAQGMLTGDLEASEGEIAALLDEVHRVLDAPELGWIFAPDVLAEVPVVGDLPGFGIAGAASQRMAGVIDRLVIGPEQVIAVDFKTNAVVPDRVEDTPDGILRQLGAYGEVLGQIFPAHRIEVGVLWTARPVYMSAGHELVSAALRDTPAA